VTSSALLGALLPLLAAFICLATLAPYWLAIFAACITLYLRRSAFSSPLLVPSCLLPLLRRFFARRIASLLPLAARLCDRSIVAASK